MITDIRSLSDMTLLKKSLQPPLTIGLTSGVFDLFHPMHLVYLKRCRAYCDILLVGVDSDHMVTISKGPGRPIIPEHQRLEVINGLECVSVSFILRNLEDFYKLVKYLGIAVIFRNEKFRGKANEVIGNDLATIIIIPDSAQHSSTTEIITRIKTST